MTMDWSLRRRGVSPKRHYPRHARTFCHNPRQSRLFSWCLCFLVFILIVYWPKKGGSPPSKTRQKRPSGGAVPPPRIRREADAPIHKPPKKQRTVESTEHVYRADGLLDVNPKGKHPILELIERSETQWERKVERQSKTLKQAVDEYKRRYKRLPPKGFEIWYVIECVVVSLFNVHRWDYVDFHDVKLVDEYDSIHARLEPFWGVDPAVLQGIQADWEAHADTFTIGKLPDSSTVELLNNTLQDDSYLGRQRIQDQLDLLEDVQEWLPEFRATFTSHDGPTQFVSWELRKKAEEAAERGECVCGCVSQI